MSNSKNDSGIAIVGMAGRFPKAKNVEEFWRNLCGGVECISFFTDEELAAAGDNYPKTDPNYVKARGLLENADKFDASFFGVTPREAEVMDPQHRIFLECAWEALEHAGYDSEKYDGSIGVFAGMSMNTYFAHNLISRPDLIAQAGEYSTMLGNDKDFLPTRVSYKLNLRGPSLNIQTACSTSLVAVCVACENLLNYNCDMALAGAVSIMFPQERGYLFQVGGISSPDGHCRPFDANGAGTVVGGGVGIVALKRVEDAIRDGDTIYAVIKGFGVNNDGANKIGFTAPSVDGQAEAIAMAHAMAEISPDTISYVEAHGTATPLGDPIEIEGLTKAFRSGTDKKNFCAVGSVKSNVGHLDAAAGVVGLIKVALALHHKKLPPTLHFESPNPKIDFKNSPFYVNAELKNWQRNGSPLRAGISSFGIGGTNSHVVLEEAPELKISNASRPAQLLMLSAKTESALDAATKNLVAHLKENPEINLADAAYTLQTGRREFPQRRILVCHDANDAIKILESGDAKKIFSKSVSRENPPVIFMFPGQGSQQINMARGLYENEPLFRQTVDQCAEILQQHLPFDFRSTLFPSDAQSDSAREQLTKTVFTQPAIFVVEYALAKLWMSWGILPEALIGHSIGEYVAATLAGVFSLEDALHIVAARGRMMQELPPGTMLAVRLPENEIVPLLNGHLSLATVNAASLCVISGANEVVAELQNELAKRNVLCTPLRTSHAFHSLMMEPILEPFTKLIASVERRAPQIPFISNVTGTWISAEDATNPNYWAKHLRQTVRFADGIGELLKSPERIFLEVGPSQTLSNLTKQHPSRNLKTSVISSLATGKNEFSDFESLLNALGQLWLNGARPDWKKFYSKEQRKRIALPTYPFERKRFWVEPIKSKSTQPAFTLGVEAAAEKEEPVEIKNGHVAPAPMADKNEIVSRLKILLTELSGFDLVEMDGDTTFAEMGFDSLFLTKVSLALEKKFGARVAFRQLLEEFSSLNVLAAHIESNLSTEKISAPAVADDEPEKIKTNSIVTVPLMDGQRELWLATQMDEQTSSAYNECRLLHLRGELQPENLARTIQLLVNRHEALRTTFSATGESQNIRSTLDFKLAQFDLSSLDEKNRAQRLDELELAEARQPFDLVNGPLFRATLIRLAENHHVLILTLHHIICDGHAFAVLFRDLWKIYSAICAGEEIKLPEPLQLSDYVRAKTQAEENSLRDKSEKYWVETFSGGAPALELPSDFSRPTTMLFEGGCETRLLPATLTRELKNISARHDSTLFVTLLGAFYAFLHRLTAQDDLVVGVPIADRNLSGADIMVGHCVNFLPVRSAIKSSATFDNFLAGTKKNFLEAHEHQHCTLGNLLQKLNLPRNPGRMPLVSVTFNVDQFKEKLQFTGIEAELANNPHSYINFDLGVNLTEIDSGLQMDCRYNAGLFSAETIQRWLGHFQTLLESVTANSRQHILELSMLSEAEHQKILGEWNQTQMDFPREKCIHQLFEEQVARAPNATAIIFGDDEVTYGELNLRAEGIRVQLRALGVGPDVPVGICMERSPDMVSAMLGILKAGGAYVPLDPNYPQDRVAFMLENSRAPVLLTQTSLRNNSKSENSNLKILCVDELLNEKRNGESKFDAQSAKAPQANNLAYIIYTSGSTGVPKGVAIEHRNAVNFISWTQKIFSAEEFSGVLAATSICFDLSIFEIFATLSCGGKIILAKNALELPSLPRKNEVRLINTVPSAIRELLRLNGVPESVRTVNLAGEPLTTELANQIYEQTHVEKVFDLYGPSETTTYSTFMLRKRNGRATIGKPLANTQVYLLDQNFQPVPVSVPGEIFIGGDGVARGYLHRDDLTAERFLQNPFAPNSRIYKTGDIARWLPDGNIKYLGRGDRQVKIRGFRIELGEIESALAKHPAVRECVMLAREDSPSDKRLAAYIVRNADQIVTASDLRSFLEGKLPDYMVPAFVFLDVMPLTPNGKIDKRALPAPQQSQIEVAETFIAPASPTEETLAQIWRDVLRIEKIGVRDNFFELGGHSLLVTRVVSRVCETFQIEMTMREFFNAPTISSLAAAIEEAIVEQVSQMSDEQINRFNSDETVLRDGENSPCSKFLDEGINRR